MRESASVVGALMQIVGRMLGWSPSGESERADLTAADLLVRGSIAAAIFVGLVWLIVR